MTQLIIWAVVAYGMTNILVYGSIFNGLRDKIHNWGNNELLPFDFLGKFLCVMYINVGWVFPFISIFFTKL